MPSSSLTANMAVDDTSVLLLLLIVGLLVFSALTARWYQPTIHPLILGRQSDASQVHNRYESPVYRNANSPHGMLLGTKPGKTVGDVRAVLETTCKKRAVYDAPQKSNADLVAEARKFAQGLASAATASNQASSASLSLAIVVERDSYFSLAASLAGSLVQNIETLIIPPLHLPDGQPGQLPTSTTSSSKLSAVFTTPAAIKKAAAMAIVDDARTLFVLADQEQASLAQRELGSSRKLNIATFREISEKGGDSNDSNDAAAAAAASFWLGSHWTRVSHRAITAGITTYLSFFPADKIPTDRDTIYVEQSSFVSSPSLHLGAAATPAGFTLALTALFTGAALKAGPLTTSLDDPNPAVHGSLAKSDATLLYASPSGASSLGLALTALSKTSPLGRLFYAGKLRSLRHGALRNDTFYDSLLFRSVREQQGVGAVRALNIVGQGWTVPQRLIDVLRVHLGVPVMNAFLPAASLTPVNDTSTSEPAAAVWTTAPIASSHAYDLQAFQANNGISEMPAHVGPPGVSVELKIQGDGEKASSSSSSSSPPHGWERFASKDDIIGRVLVRGNILTGLGDQDVELQPWHSVPTDDGDGGASPPPPPQHGLFRSNGTLLVLPPSIHAEKRATVNIPTMSAKYPIKGKNKIGAGREGEVDDDEKSARSKKDL